MINTISTVSFAIAMIRPASTIRFAILAILRRRAIICVYMVVIFLGYFFLIDSRQMYGHFRIQTKCFDAFFFVFLSFCLQSADFARFVSWFIVFSFVLSLTT